MPVTKIRRDSHGLYIRTDGHVFRPERTKWTYATAETEGEGWQEGERVKAYHISQTPDAKLRSLERNHEGRWHSHGVYIRSGRNISSNQIWAPIEEEED